MKDLHALVQGPANSPAVIFLHAFPLNSAMWTEQMKECSKSFHCVALDLPGFGKSPLPSHAFTFEHYVESVENFLRVKGIQKSIWCGLSMGGYVALRLYERAPELCSGLVLCDTRSGADNEEGKLKRWAAIKAVTENKDAFVEAQFKALTAPTSQEKAPIREAFLSMAASQSAEAIAAGLAAMANRTDTGARLVDIHVPTKIIVGAEDKVTSPLEAEKLLQAITGSTLTVIPGAGHLSNLEAPSEFNQALLAFLKDLDN
jgi:3-oxoadipate enol-lactonase